MHPEQDQIWQFWWSSGGPVGFGKVRRLRGVILEGEEIEGGHSGEVRRLRGVILAK